LSGTSSLLLSVSELVEFSARCGDLFTHHQGPSSLEGIRGHQKVQYSRDEQWQKEVSLAQNIQFEELNITLQGRLDLLCENILHPIIEEIKTTYVDSSELPSAKKKLHWAQAKVYAFLYCLEDEEIPAADVRVTWLNLATQKTNTENETCSRASLISFSHELLRTYVIWYREISSLRQKTIESAQALDFPFQAFRQGQHSFSKLVYQAIRNKHSLLIEAPTGAGKTISTLFPAVKARGKTLCHQIVYLTIKNSAKTQAFATIKKMAKNGLILTYLTLQSRENACPCRHTENTSVCRNEEGICTRTLGFFDRLPQARMACLQIKHLDMKSLGAIANTFHLCPFELSLHLAPWCDIIICDVNYFFDPQIRLPLFDQHVKTRVLFIDEVHNLPDRGREMYSAELSLRESKNITKVFAKRWPKLSKRIARLCKVLEGQADSSQNLTTPPTQLCHEVDNILSLIGSLQRDKMPGELPENLQKEFSYWLKSLYRFHIIAERFNDTHVCIYKKYDSNTTLTLFCRDASLFLQKSHKSARCTIGFSATLSPIDYFRDSIGLPAHTKAYSLPQVFPSKNQLTLRCDYIDTRWRQRKHSLAHLVTLIAEVFLSRPGKYLVYLPSYDYLDSVLGHFSAEYPQIDTSRQTRSSNENERHQFLDAFFSLQSERVGFAILGGIFGEGIDFVGESLTGVFIVGSGMPQPNTEKKLMEEYFSHHGVNGFQYVYQFPGMVRVLQTAGRVIRAENEKGLVILIDPRFRKREYHSLLPKHWQIRPCLHIDDVRRNIAEFWKKR